MKLLSLLFTVASLLYIVSAAPSSETCKPGDTFKAKDACNTCTCTKDGRKENADCSNMLCLFEKEKSDIQCKPYTTFQYKCYLCFCPESGLRHDAGCYSMTCDRPN
ncbi:unnamed protein product [Rhizopus microsporus]|uniref:Pacifastin domain-containing protein n=1 Tax=Rhizopus microsporus TaxID=58291 RepID=A0A0A1PE28_RHIZD|nr:hypothetical protein BCV71DRAFT_91698 [Rhizopus microsporus]CEJ02369.1 hypothetical protein RMCBS344292_16376 [Rhizopus microsporus]